MVAVSGERGPTRLRPAEERLGRRRGLIALNPRSLSRVTSRTQHLASNTQVILPFTLDRPWSTSSQISPTSSKGGVSEEAG